MPNNIKIINQNVNQVNEIENINSNETKSNYIFKTQAGIKTIIIMNGNKTVEQLLKEYALKAGFSNDDIEKEKIYFYYDGCKINKNEQKKVKDFFKINPEITVSFSQNLTNLSFEFKN